MNKNIKTILEEWRDCHKQSQFSIINISDKICNVFNFHIGDLNSLVALIYELQYAIISITEKLVVFAI